MDDQGVGDYGAVVMTPYYYGDDTFELGWLGFWTSQEAMGAGLDNYTDFGKAYQHNANGGGRQKMNEIMGDMLDCDAARVYNAKRVRSIAAADEGE